MQNFKELNLPPALLGNLMKMKYETPTPIQAQAIPLALAGKDVLGTAQTGTGKTAAFGIPLVARLLASPRGTALIMTPTRELAVQVQDVLKQLLGTGSLIKTALLIGGESMPQQISALRARPRIIVGTPGRINDHLARGTLMLHEVCFLVLDETDRMLDMGFSAQLEKIVKFLPPARQTLLFSATMPDNIVKIANTYMKSPERIAVGATNTAVSRIKQEIVHITAPEKHNALLKELAARQGSIIIFVKTKHGADRLADKLNRSGHSADAIHGDLHQRKREKVIQAFRDKRHRIMVATDIAARGLDIPHIEHVINYDLPQCPEDYIHRIGRTARAGAEGASVCLIAPEDMIRWKEIHKLMNPGEPLPRHPHAPAPSPKGPNGGSTRRGGSRHGGQNHGSQGQRSEGGNGNNGNRRRFRGARKPAPVAA